MSQSRRRRRTSGALDRLPSGRYRVRVTDPATGRRVSIGSYATKADADRAYARALTDQDRGSFLPPELGRISLAEYADRWVESRLTSGGEPLRPRVRELYDGHLRLHILPTLGPVDLGRLRPATIRAWHGHLITSGCGASTAAKCYRLLRAILSTAVTDGLIASNPCTINGGGVEPKAERSIPTPAEVQALATRVPDRFSAMVLLAGFCGLRRGELFGLRRRDVELLRGTVSIVEQRQQSATGAELVGPPKTEAGRRTVTLPASLRTGHRRVQLGDSGAGRGRRHQRSTAG